MLTQLSYIINKVTNNDKNILFFRGNDKLSYNIFQNLLDYNFYVWQISHYEKWNFDQYITNDNINFIHSLDHISDVDISLIIMPYAKEMVEITKHLIHIPKVSLFETVVDYPINTQIERLHYGDICLCPSEEIFDFWKLDSKGKIIPDWDMKQFKSVIEKVNESNFS